MAKKIDFSTEVIEFYGVSQEGAFIVGKPKEVLLGVVKFSNESDYKFFKKCFKGFMNGVLYGENAIKQSTARSYKIFKCNRFVDSVVNIKAVA